MLVALGLFAAGSALVIYEHTGTPARVTVTQCLPQTKGYYCTGVWSPATGPAQVVTVDGADSGDVGHTLDVHMHSGSNTATTTDWRMPALCFGFGVLFLVASAITAVLVRRQR